MATETLEGKRPGVESSPAKEKEEANSHSNEEAERKNEDELEGIKSEEEKVETQRSRERPTRERKKVELFSLSTPLRPTPAKSLSIEKVLLSFVFFVSDKFGIYIYFFYV